MGVRPGRGQLARSSPWGLQMAQAWWTEGGDRVVRQETQMGAGETEMATFNLGEAGSIDISQGM